MASVNVIDAKDKLKCVERELKLRRSVYPRWVYARKMTHEQAQREIAVMEAIVEDYRRFVAVERPELPL